MKQKGTPSNSKSCTSDKPKESCGLFGIYGIPDAAPLIYQGLYAQQHRGQEGAGIVVSNGEKIRSVKDAGLVSEVFSKNSISEGPAFIESLRFGQYCNVVRGTPRLSLHRRWLVSADCFE